MGETISLKSYHKSHYDELIKFDLPQDQINFTALPGHAIEQMNNRIDQENLKAITIVLKDKPIGFFILDYGKDKLELTDNINSLLLLSLSINHLYQGKGYGKKAMYLLDEFIKSNYTNIEELVLAVNFKNKSAYQLYLKVGYIDEGKSREWLQGFQHLLKKKLI
ncbi:GNAT family N-acetyltransferase [Chishuiella sp.]|uniref:GNAT family N-acetyltransferase n=1 Tax=Chishuiella sp. TaxID=1969467 RepID=UPI0028A6A28B|nr:GNAT family N-acetyltransferase [Chishuiella sp.]